MKNLYDALEDTPELDTRREIIASYFQWFNDFSLTKGFTLTEKTKIPYTDDPISFQLVVGNKYQVEEPYRTGEFVYMVGVVDRDNGSPLLLVADQKEGITSMSISNIQLFEPEPTVTAGDHMLALDRFLSDD